jgi:hypothetical protein
MDIAPDDCRSFVHKWRTDLARWSDRMASLPAYDSVRGALNHLDLQGTSLEVR